MRISTQTGDGASRRSLDASKWAIALFCLLVGWGAPALAQEGQVQCTISENGTASRGTIVVEQSGRKVASGSCARPVSVPAGASKVTIRLDKALDSPAKTVDVSVAAGKIAQVSVDFETAILEVRVETKGTAGTAIIAIEKAGKRIGTVGSGVPAKLSASTYQVVVSWGGQEKRYEVELRPGQRRLVRAQF